MSKRAYQPKRFSSSLHTSVQQYSRKGTLAIGIFLFFAAAAASYAGLTLIFPGTILDRAWALNPRAHGRLAPLGGIVGIPFLFLAITLAVAGIGWFQQRLWAWRLTVIILAIQLFGDFVNAFSADPLGGSFGVLIASALLFYLFRPGIRSAFTT